MPIERKLAAIMFTDIAGYTEQMSKSESKTLNLLEKKLSILKPLLKEYKGTFVKEMGDGTLSYFDSAVNAATCAVKLQEKTYDDKEMNIRVGIHIGDIVFKDGDVFGGGVNVASRLESIAPAGGVCVSKSVYDELSNQDDFDGIELGLQSLKGVGRLIEVFGLKGDKLNEPDPQKYQENKVAIHSDDEVPSIAIIPFDNKGADEDSFYAYGISVDLISDVSSAGLIRIASKKQIDEAGELQQDKLAKKLDVRYMANGELWRMGDMFQLSVELYDTKNKKVVWSDRWQEKWDNLPTIKINLSDGLLKALDTKPKVEQKVDTTNTEAYEFYLKAKHKYEKRDNMEDTEIARGLLRKAIELDDKLLLAKNLLGITYSQMGDYDTAMGIYLENFKQAKELDDIRIEAMTLHNIGIGSWIKNEYNKALDYYARSLKICEDLGDKLGMGISLNSIGIIYFEMGDKDKALVFYNRSLKAKEDLSDKLGIGASLGGIGNVYFNKGDHDKAIDYFNRSLMLAEEHGENEGKGRVLGSIGNVYGDKGDLNKALDYYARSLKICEDLGDKLGMGLTLNNIGLVHAVKGDYEKTENYLEKSLSIQKEIGLGGELPLWTTTCLYLTYKHLGRAYDVKEIHTLIKDAENIESELNLRLYELLEDKSYLETAYNQVQEKADDLKPDVAAKFLSYPIPKAIMEEWEKVK